ncbi:hypothetical protein CQW23_14595 [Capsicum baccatum]|uniref:Uncharacterized protein n=1 Tax=Capsicum baccatum TaxID=33114 RepID=A0A2G2WJL2_CAPBA|nr:hypothetical protein CQW23_14595 [Capsicum baccatum]
MDKSYSRDNRQSSPRAHIDRKVWHLDVGSSPPGAVVCSKGRDGHPLKRDGCYGVGNKFLELEIDFVNLVMDPVDLGIDFMDLEMDFVGLGVDFVDVKHLGCSLDGVLDSMNWWIIDYGIYGQLGSGGG